MTRAWLVLLAACEARAPLASDFKLALAPDESLLRTDPTLLGLHVHTDKDNHVDLCVRNGPIDLRLATLTLEKDVTQAYHLRVGALDSALNSDVLRQITNADLPTSLVRGLAPFELALAAAIDSTEYVLTFCRQDGSSLTCESPLGLELSTWEKTDALACESPPTCASLPVDTPIATCLAKHGTICELLRPGGEQKVLDCVLAELPNVDGVTLAQLRVGCDEVDDVLRLGRTFDALCANSPVDLCTPLKRAENVRAVCLQTARIFDTAARCCQAQLQPPPPDAGIDAPPADAPDGGVLDGLLPDLL